MNIFVGVMCIGAIAAGIFGWWMEHGSAKTEKEPSNEQNKTDPKSGQREEA